MWSIEAFYDVLYFLYVSVLLGYMDSALFFCTIGEKRLIYLKRVIFFLSFNLNGSNFYIVIVILTRSWTLMV